MIVLFSVFTSCQQNEDLNQEPISRASSNAVSYSRLVEKYNISDVTDAETIEKAKKLKGVTPEELDVILESLFRESTPLIKIGNSFPKKQEKINVRSARSNVVVVSASNSDGRADVHLDTDNVSVETSSVYYTDFMDVFLYYTHLSGSANKSGDVINFTANGEVVVKIIWEGVEIKRIPTVIRGYYNVSSQSGTLTDF